MLGYDYLIFNTVTLPRARSNNTNYKNQEDVATSESGHDKVTVQRLEKGTFSYTFRVTDFWLSKLMEFCALGQGTLQINGVSHTVRPRLKSKKVVDGSELTKGTDGLYDLSIDFMEL